MQQFRSQIRFPVRFSDLDAMGHVNNARYITYFEEGRADWFRQCLHMSEDSTAYPVIVARIEIDYIAPIPFGATVIVGTRCIRLGKKSMDFEGQIAIKHQGDITLAARYQITLVFYDYTTKTTHSIPDTTRAQIIAFESPNLEA